MKVHAFPPPQYIAQIEYEEASWASLPITRIPPIMPHPNSGTEQLSTAYQASRARDVARALALTAPHLERVG